MGQPLDVAVEVQLDPSETMTSACFSADVFHGDARQNPSGVTVRLETTSVPSTALVHVTSRSRVDEPIVTVYLRAGCAQMSSRRYTVLADLVSEADRPLAAGVAAAPMVNPESAASPVQVAPRGAGPTGQDVAIASPRAARANGARQTPGSSQTSKRARPNPSRRVDPVRPAPAPARKAAALNGASVVTPTLPAVVRSEGQSRLTLDPLDLSSGRPATLESEAAATAPLVDTRAARESEQLDRLEVSVNALLLLAQKNEASLMDVRSRIDKAQADRWDNRLIYILFGLLLFSLLVIAYFLTRMNRRQQRDDARWLDAGSVDPDPELPESMTRSARPALSQPRAVLNASPAVVGAAPVPVAQADGLATEPTQLMIRTQGVPDAGGGHAQVDVSLVEMSESTFDRLMQSGAGRGAVWPTRETPTPALRIDADALIDIRQRAEFFVTLGQTDQAVQVLEARVAEDPASCPQVHLDLLTLFHSLGLKADFNQVSDDFARLFNTGVPDFADFDNEGRSIEEYPGVVDRLIAAWPRPTVRATLEQIICRGYPGESAIEPFDLAAFRDLLLLHAVAQSVHGAAARGRTGDGPAVVVADNEMAQVDIDLTELVWPEVAPTLAMPRDDAPPSIADTESPTQAPSSGNLIDFDLSDDALAGGSSKDDR